MNEETGSRHLDPEEILDLALGLVPADRQARMMEHLSGCEACSAVLRDRARAVERAHVTAPAQRPPRRRTARWLVPSLAVAAVVVFVLLLPRLKEGPSEAVWLPLGQEAPALRGEALPADLRAGIEAYREHDAVAAIAAFERAREDDELDLRGRVLLASAYELSGEPTRAVDLLGEIDLLLIPPPWRDRARGVYARALIQLGRVREAEAVLSGMERDR